MDKFFSGLNLQNLLRQFCCGVIFFVPLFLFVPNQFYYIWRQAGIVEDRLICVAVLSFIIGTVIYHLEKNLYSYLIQAAFESIGEKLLRAVLIIFVLMVMLFWIADCCLPTLIGIVLVLLVIACIICFLIPLFSRDFNHKAEADSTDEIYCKIVDALIDRTEKCWLIEKFVKDKWTPQYSIAKKVSIWSDFIHCVQSCCIAWIMGTIAAYYLHPCFLCGCDASRCIYLHDMSVGVEIAMTILLVEIGIDAHRYIYVIRMTSSVESILNRKHSKKDIPTSETQNDKQ